MRFASPSWLALLLLVPVLGLLLFRLHRWRRLQAIRWKASRYAPLGLLFPLRRMAWRGAAFFFAAVASIFALAKPLGQLQAKDSSQQALDIVILLDLSPTMRLRDVLPDRWQRSVLEIAAFFRRQQGDRFALVAADREAGLLCPWTDDTSALQDILWQSPPGTLDDDGSGFLDALPILLALFRRPTQASQAQVLVFLSDGLAPSQGLANAQTKALLQEIAKAGVSVFVLSIGTKKPPSALPSSVSDAVPLPPFEPLEEAPLRSIASFVGGTYATLSSQGFGLQNVHRALLSKKRQALRSQQAKDARPLHRPFLLAAVCFLFFALVLGFRSHEPLAPSGGGA